MDTAELAELAGATRQDPDELDIGEIFDLLKNERRRRVIAFLDEQEEGTTTLDAVAEHIAALENDVDVARLSSQQRKRVYIALYQCHLPKMDHFGVIDFDKNRGTIELVNTTLLDPYLAGSDPDADDTGDRTDLIIAASVTAIVTVGLTGIGILAAIPVVLWTGVTVVALWWIAAT